MKTYRYIELKDFEIGPYTIDVVCILSDDVSYPVHRLVDVDCNRLIETVSGMPMNTEDVLSEIWDDLEDHLNANYDCLPYWEA